MLTFIGDVHAKFGEYKEIIASLEGESIQVGDFGIGFESAGNYSPITTMRLYHKFIRGNHDNPHKCPGHISFIGDGTYLIRHGVFCVGGARSIDILHRTHGFNWWPEEELGYYEALSILDKYARLKPTIVVTHDAPTCVYDTLYMQSIRSINQQLFDEMLKVHKPQLWVHGHLHKAHKTQFDYTTFVGLAELGTFTIGDTWHPS